MLSITAIFWLTFAVLGESCLLAVLLTLAFVKSLPQRKNLFLINFLLTTFLAQIPPLLLFITGQLNDTPPKILCLAQSVLMDGVGPMFAVALVVFVLQIWAELRAIIFGLVPITAKFSSIKALLLLIPYIALVSWCIASLGVAAQTPAELGLTQIVYCGNNSMLGSRVRRFVGLFMLACGVIEFSIEACIGRMLRVYFLGGKRRTCGKSIVNYSFAVRVFILCLLQAVSIMLSALNSWFRLSSPQLWDCTHILESMNALATFIVFGTSKELLQVWGIKKQGNTKETSGTQTSEISEHAIV